MVTPGREHLRESVFDGPAEIVELPGATGRLIAETAVEPMCGIEAGVTPQLDAAPSTGVMA